jgi:hypothetical protein
LLYLNNERQHWQISLKIAASGIINFYTRTARPINTLTALSGRRWRDS